jgi:hypothetical protein
MDLVGLAGLFDQRNGEPAPDGGGTDLARRYALFALVGITGEEDLDAPDLLVEPSSAIQVEPNREGQPGRKPANGSVHKPRQPKPVLAAGPSAILRERMIAEICDLKDGDELALWAHQRLPAKNTLTADDAAVLERTHCRQWVGRRSARAVDDPAMPITSNLHSHDPSGARSVTNSPCPCAVSTIGICTALATRSRGGLTSR